MTGTSPFATLDPESAREEFGLGKDSSDWTVERALDDVVKTGTKPENIREILYRPFDLRWTYYTGKSGGVHVRPRDSIMKHMLQTNVALLFSRVTKDEPSCLVTNALVAHKSSTRYDITYFAPLWIDDAENLSPAFREFIKARYKDHHCKAEEILGYIYAVLHAPTYRRRYAEFLRIDFPRIPFAEKREDFEELSKLGTELIEAHLFRNFPRRGLADYHGRGDNSVEKPRYVEAEARVFINETQSFAPVPKNVWEFHIGGYQVLDKYLKSRKGRRLSLDEINHVAAVADTLAFTIEQMARIDDAWTAAFPDRG